MTKSRMEEQKQDQKNPSEKILGGYYEVEYSPDAQEGLNLLKQMPQDCALVFLDYSKSSGKTVSFWDNSYKKKYQLTHKGYSWLLEKAA